MTRRKPAVAGANKRHRCLLVLPESLRRTWAKARSMKWLRVTFWAVFVLALVAFVVQMVFAWPLHMRGESDVVRIGIDGGMRSLGGLPLDVQDASFP